MAKKVKKKTKTAARRRRTPAKNASRVAFFFQQALKQALSWLPASPSQSAGEPIWRHLWWLLAAAFVLRALVSLSGDFVIHPDEIMQYLEPAHGLIFGNSISHWEYFYGARSWIIPGFVAGILQLSVWLGLESTNYYVNAVKLGFCVLSLSIPYGMYVAGRHLFGEMSGRLALLLAVFWYELLGFAHKPMTEFVATSLLFVLIAVVMRPPRPTIARATVATLIAVLVVSVRFHYAPLAGLILLTEFMRGDNRIRTIMPLVGLAGVAAVGLLDYVTWGGFLHSYWVNLQVNLLANTERAGESTVWHFPVWLSLASGGAFWAALAAVAGTYFRRRFHLLLLLVVIVLPHMLQEHREYRFIFAAIPLWLLLFADLLAVGWQKIKKIDLPDWRSAVGVKYAVIISVVGIFNTILAVIMLPDMLQEHQEYRFIFAAILPDMLQEHRDYHFIFAAIPLWILLFIDLFAVGWQKIKKIDLPHWRPAVGIAYAVIISAVGIFNAIPFQKFVYEAYSQETGYVNFLVGQDPTFVAYRHLADSDDVRGVWDTRDTYFNTGGYYYLHHRVPFYDYPVGHSSFAPAATARHVSHIITAQPIEPNGIIDAAGGLAMATEGGYLPLPRIVNDKTIGKLVYWDIRGESQVLDEFIADVNFGDLHIWTLDDKTKSVRDWRKYEVSPDSQLMDRFIERALGKRLRPPAKDFGVEFADR